MLKSILIIILFTVLNVFVSSCSDSNPVESEEDHFEAIGLFVIAGNDTIVKYEDLMVSGDIEIAENDTTDLFSIKFLEEDGHIGVPPTDEWSLDWFIGNATNAEVVASDSQKESYQIKIAGKNAGQTTIRIIINHHGHKDYESAELPITVNTSD